MLVCLCSTLTANILNMCSSYSCLNSYSCLCYFWNSTKKHTAKKRWKNSSTTIKPRNQFRQVKSEESIVLNQHSGLLNSLEFCPYKIPVVEEISYICCYLFLHLLIYILNNHICYFVLQVSTHTHRSQ